MLKAREENLAQTVFGLGGGDLGDLVFCGIPPSPSSSPISRGLGIHLRVSNVDLNSFNKHKENSFKGFN